MPSPQETSARPAVDWGPPRTLWRILVYGAGGARGRDLVQALLAAGHPGARLTLYGRKARSLTWHGETLAIQPTPPRPPPAELAFLCTPGEVSRALAASLAGRGTRVIDLSGALGADAGLALAELNGEELGAFTEELALPLASTALIALPLAVLERAVGLAEVDLFAVVGAAAQGARSMYALRAELVELGRNGGAPALAPGARAGNLRAAEAYQPGFEDLLGRELCALLRRPDLLLDVTALAGDLERCDLFAVKLLLHAPLDLAAVPELFAQSSSIALEPDGEGPVPARCVGSARVHVGRIRAGSRGPRSLCFLAAGDQLRAGSSCAALRVASRLPAAA